MSILPDIKPKLLLHTVNLLGNFDPMNAAKFVYPLSTLFWHLSPIIHAVMNSVVVVLILLPKY